MTDPTISMVIEQLWARIEKKEAYMVDLEEELADAGLELEDMYTQLDELRYQQGEG